MTVTIAVVVAMATKSGGVSDGVSDVDGGIRGGIARVIEKREAEMILATVLSSSRASIIAHPDRVLSTIEAEKTHAMVTRRAAGEPMAYILGTREFYGREFMVSPAVLIPRPETELLVEQALVRLSKHSPAKNCVLDLGTGSGAIAVSVAAEHPDAAVTATDISAAALAVAARNAAQHGVQISFIQSDWFGGLQGKKFDLILSNPPYVAEGDPHLLQGDLRYEPRQALTDQAFGEQGLAHIRRIIAGAPQHLCPGGWLLFEHGFDQAIACQRLLAEGGFLELVAWPDLAGITRVSGGRIPS